MVGRLLTFSRLYRIALTLATFITVRLAPGRRFRRRCPGPYRRAHRRQISRPASLRPAYQLPAAHAKVTICLVFSKVPVDLDRTKHAGVY